MGRPKGSKNRATLEREARERETREREEKEREAKNRETAECKNIDKQSIKLPSGADVESNPSVYLGEGENGSERTLEGITKVGDETEDKRGDKSDSNSDSNSNSNAKSKVRLKKSSLPQCERCGAEIPCDPLKLDTNLLTGKADYHRESRRYVRLCNKCGCELSELVDRWLWDKRKRGNPELRKFPLKDEG